MLIALIAGAGVAYLSGRLAVVITPQRSAEPAPAASMVEPEPAIREALPADVPLAEVPGATPEVGVLAPRDHAIRKQLTVAGSSTVLLLSARLARPLLVPGVALLGWSFAGILRMSWRDFRQEGKVGAPALDAIALTGIMLSGHWTLAASAALVSGLADWLGRRTERRSRADLADAFGQRSMVVRRVSGDEIVEVPWEQLVVDDIIVVDAGESVPVDGTIVKGHGSLDEQRLTGEAIPIERSPGDEVHATTLLLDGRLYVQVRRSGTETMAAELLSLLTEVEQTRAEGISRAQGLIEKWAPATLGFAAGALAFYGPIGAVAVTASGIGYGVRYAGPTAALRHIRIALDGGVLIRDGRALERLDEVDVVVFDKTGTLTRSMPSVRRVLATGEIGPREVLRLAATAERHQSHPIGKALREAAAANGMPAAELEQATVLPGLGLSVRIEGRAVLVGSARLMMSHGIDIPSYRSGAQAAHDDGSTIRVHVAVDGELAGLVELAPQLRPEAQPVVAALQRRGIDVLVLSGDQEAPTASTARALGLDGYAAGVLPQGKAEYIERLQGQGKTVCFVGDGINDAIALGRADVSISMQGAASVAQDVADILLLEGDLVQIPALFSLSASLNRNVEQSSGISVATGLASISGVFGLGLGMNFVMLMYQGGIAVAMGNALLRDVQFETDESGTDPPGIGEPASVAFERVDRSQQTAMAAQPVVASHADGVPGRPVLKT